MSTFDNKVLQQNLKMTCLFLHVLSPTLFVGNAGGGTHRSPDVDPPSLCVHWADTELPEIKQIHSEE